MKLWIKIVIGLATMPVVVSLGLLGWILYNYLTEGDIEPTVSEPAEETETIDQATTEETEEPEINDNSDFGSCDEDYVTYCQDAEPGKINRVNCLLNEHYDEISDACRNSLERRQQLNEELVAACEVDRAKFCKGIEPKVGAEPMVECLNEYYPELSPDCAAAFDAHEATKPDDQKLR